LMRAAPCAKAALLCICCAVGLSACDQGDGRARGSGGGSDAARNAAAAVADHVIIHPLTRVGLDSVGKPALVLHMEVKDRFGQTIKSLGRLRVELYRPTSEMMAGSNEGEGSTAGVQKKDRTWEIDLTDPLANSQRFDDLITRTYTIFMADPPGWLLAWAAGKGGNVSPNLQVAFTVVDERGVEKVLRASLRMTK